MLTHVFTYGPMIAAIIALIIKWRGMKKYIPAGLFASLYANVICHIAMSLNCWTYPNKLEEAIANCVVVPVLAMYWIRYAPIRLSYFIYWNLLWTSVLTFFEYVGERFTNVIQYLDGYDWYWSFILWFVSWFIWYGFHKWFNYNKEEG